MLPLRLDCIVSGSVGRLQLNTVCETVRLTLFCSSVNCVAGFSSLDFAPKFFETTALSETFSEELETSTSIPVSCVWLEDFAAVVFSLATDPI